MTGVQTCALPISVTKSIGLGSNLSLRHHHHNSLGLGSNLSPRHHHHQSLGLGSNLNLSSRPIEASPKRISITNLGLGSNLHLWASLKGSKFPHNPPLQPDPSFNPTPWRPSYVDGECTKDASHIGRDTVFFGYVSNGCMAWCRERKGGNGYVVWCRERKYGEKENEGVGY